MHGNRQYHLRFGVMRVICVAGLPMAPAVERGLKVVSVINSFDSDSDSDSDCSVPCEPK